MIGQEISHYKILSRLGGGGMGVVYKAEDTRLGRVVALKFLSTELLSNESTRRRFLQEAKAASLIDHPNVCHVYEVGETDDGRAFMAMSYCEGRSLREVISAGPVPPHEAFSIAFGIAQGLWAAHRRGIVHRDIKPPNVILTDDGFVRIVDFGLALLIGNTRVTTSGVTVGTVAYMSPEQTSDSTVGANTDIWSLGVTLYEMLAGHLPFRGEINAALVYSIVHEPHTPLLEANSSVPPEIARIVDRCLEKDPTKRYQTIEELLEDMVRVAKELGWESSVASATIAPILRERRRRKLTRRIVISAAALAVVVGGAFAWHTFHHPSPYVTKVRLAVMPLDNLIGSENDAFVNGLSEHVSRVARWVGREQPSMWTVPFASVLSADLPDPRAAGPAFGANRVITGDVQPFENVYRLRLTLIDPKFGREIRTNVIPFRMETIPALIDTLPDVVAALIGGKFHRGSSLPWKSRDAHAARDYFEGTSLLRPASDAKTLERAVVLLDRAASGDSAFALLACASGDARYRLFRKNRDANLLPAALGRGRAARALCPQLAEADLLLGDIFTRMEMPDSAEAHYRRAVSTEPGFVTASQRLGAFYDGQTRLDEAETTYIGPTKACPDLWAAFRTLGIFYYSHDRLDEAAGAWQTALDLAPRDALTLNNLGAIHQRRAEWTAARALFLRSFQVKPNCESSSNVALALYFERKFADSAKYYEFALAYCDTTGHLPWGDLARALYWAPNGRERAIKYFGKALSMARANMEQNPDNVDMIAYVIDYEAMVGHTAEADSLIQRIKPLLKDDEQAMYRIGAVYEQLGKRQAALDMIGNAIRHGFPVVDVRADPMLQELVKDPVFLQMASTEAADGAQAAKNAH